MIFWKTESTLFLYLASSCGIDRVFSFFCVKSSLPGTRGGHRHSNNYRFVELFSNSMGLIVSFFTGETGTVAYAYLVKGDKSLLHPATWIS